MPRGVPKPGFYSEAHRSAFEEGNRLYRRGGPLASTCGARLPGGGTCEYAPLKGEARCLRHGGPAAAKRYRDRQMQGLETGRVSPAEFARAEARRARNALQLSWKRDPRVPGATIDLGEHEWAFQEAAQRRDVDARNLYPAVADWLRWQWQRTQRDRDNPAGWMRVCREDLPKRQAKADAAALWAALGGYHRGSGPGRMLAATLRSKGADAARALVADWQAKGTNLPPKRRPPLTKAAVLPWKPDSAPGTGRRRARAPQRSTSKGPPPAMTPTEPEAEHDVEENAALLRSFGPEVRQVFKKVSTPAEEREFFNALRLLRDNPGGPAAYEAWHLVLRRHKSR